MKKTICILIGCLMFSLIGCAGECKHDQSHIEKTNIVEATCTKEGSYTENIVCDCCHQIIETSEKHVDKLPHTEVIDKRVEPTFTATGLTEGKHCSVCGTILVKQEVIEKLKYTDYAFECVFSHDKNVSVGIYNGKHYDEEPLASDVAYSTSDEGVYLKDGEGQINFRLSFVEGYELDEIQITGEYKNLKKPTDTGKEDVYRVTKIASNLSIEIKTNPVKKGLRVKNDVGCNVTLDDFDENNHSQLVHIKTSPFYVLDDISLSDKSVQTKKINDNDYLFTNIDKNKITLTISTVCRKFESFAGSVIDDKGMLKWTINDPTNRINEMSCIVTSTSGSTTINVVDGKELTYQLNKSEKYAFVFNYISKGGQTFTSESQYRYFEPNLHNLDFPMIEFTTKNGLYPCADKMEAPEGCLGITCINDEYVQAITTIYNEKNEIVYSSSEDGDFSSSKIKIRGNASSVGPKKPYKIKLDKAVDLLAKLVPGRKDSDINYKNKEWALLKDGNTLNQVAGMCLGTLSKLEYTPRCRYVNVAVNGDYKGLFILTESVTQGKGEGVNQSRLKASDTGYIIEKDAYYWSEDVYFDSPIIRHSQWTFKHPDSDEIDPKGEQYNYIKNYVYKMEHYLLDTNEEAFNWIDRDSLAAYGAARMYMCSADVAGTNIYLFKYDNTKSSLLKCGPLWDFDASFYESNVEKIDMLFEKNHGNGFYLYYGMFYSSYSKLMRSHLKDIIDGIDVQFETYCTESIGEPSTYNKIMALDNTLYGGGINSFKTMSDRFISWFARRNVFLTNQYLK